MVPACCEKFCCLPAKLGTLVDVARFQKVTFSSISFFRMCPYADLSCVSPSVGVCRCTALVNA